jgi:hypothetical protein
MEQLQATFYILAIIFMILNIVILVGVGVGVYMMVKAVSDMQKQVSEKMKYVEEVARHPDELLAQVGTSLLRRGARKVKGFFEQNRDEGA